MTTNYEKIKAMSIDEMVKLLSKPPCIHCIYITKEDEDCNAKCKKGIKQWLESEEE